jgi:hypothetical protein
MAVSDLTRPVAAKRGGVLIRLKAQWPAIVGPEWATAAWPVALRAGILKLNTRPEAALEVQHRAPLLIERVNVYLGRTVVTRLALVQVTGAFAAASSDPQQRYTGVGRPRGLNAQLGAIADPELRAALERLAKAVEIADR